MKLWKLLLLLALAVALPGFSFSQEPSKRPIVYEFNVNDAASMRGFFILLGYQFYTDAPPAVYKLIVAECGDNPVFLGSAVYEGNARNVFHLCQEKREAAADDDAKWMCEVLSKKFKRDLSKVNISGTTVYCEPPDVTITMQNEPGPSP